MSDLIDVGTWGDPDHYLTPDGRHVRADGTPIITKEEATAFAEEFRRTRMGNRLMVLPDSVSYRNAEQTRSGFAQGLTDTLANPDLTTHAGRCGPRWRPLRAWFGLTAWKFKSCMFDWGGTGFCERRYVWDRGQWRRLLSERQLTQLEREVLL